MSNKKREQDSARGAMAFLDPGENAPEALTAEVEVPIVGGVLDGLRITGIRIWRSKDQPGDFYVTFPAKTYESHGETRYWDYLRGEKAKAARNAIVDAYKAQKKEVSGQ